MESFTTKALLMAVLRYSQEVSDPKKLERFIMDLLNVDAYVPKTKK